MAPFVASFNCFGYAATYIYSAAATLLAVLTVADVARKSYVLPFVVVVALFVLADWDYRHAHRAIVDLLDGGFAISPDSRAI